MGQPEASPDTLGHRVEEDAVEAQPAAPRGIRIVPPKK
jgi:hypothetical protein